MRKNQFSTVSMHCREIDRLRKIAEEEHRSMAQQISYWIEQHIDSKSQNKSA